jgi:hypothetical protein
LLVCLVAMTTPTLSIAVLVPRALVARIRSRHLSAALLGVSALWLLLVSGAGFALIEHRHIGVVLFGHNLTVMLF